MPIGRPFRSRAAVEMPVEATDPGPFDPAQLVEPELSELFGYWHGKRDGRTCPARRDVDPLDIPHLLSNLILVDTAESLQAFRYRVFGTEVCRGFGSDRTGVTLGELAAGVENHEFVFAGYWRAFELAQPDYFHGRTVSFSRDYKRYSRLLLPLSEDGARVDMILGGMVFFQGDPLRQSVWPERASPAAASAT